MSKSPEDVAREIAEQCDGPINCPSAHDANNWREACVPCLAHAIAQAIRQARREVAGRAAKICEGMNAGELADHIRALARGDGEGGQ